MDKIITTFAEVLVIAGLILCTAESDCLRAQILWTGGWILAVVAGGIILNHYDRKATKRRGL